MFWSLFLQFSSTLYDLVTFHSGDIAPSPASNCTYPTTSIHKFMTWIDEAEYVNIQHCAVHSLPITNWQIDCFQINGRKEGNVFNDALNTFYLRLYGVRYMVKDHSDSERGNLLLPHRLLFLISSKGSFICVIPQTG